MSSIGRVAGESKVNLGLDHRPKKPRLFLSNATKEGARNWPWKKGVGEQGEGTGKRASKRSPEGSLKNRARPARRDSVRHTHRGKKGKRSQSAVTNSFAPRYFRRREASVVCRTINFVPPPVAALLFLPARAAWYSAPAATLRNG